jgi:hypothetical protein
MNWINIKDELPKLGEQVMVCQEVLDMYHIDTATLDSVPINEYEYKLEWVTPLTGRKMEIQNVEYWAVMPAPPECD